MNSWRNNNKTLVNDDWDKDNSNRSQRFKEYGQSEINRQKYNSKHPQKQLEQKEYIQKKQEKYPLISKDVSKNQMNQKDLNPKPTQQNNNESFYKPSVKVPDRYKMLSAMAKGSYAGSPCSHEIPMTPAGLAAKPK